jgi:RecG-like helicase
MDSATIAKISKAREYAQEPERMTITNLQVFFQGKHQNYPVTFDHGTWRCECEFFGQRGYCSHTMAVEKVIAKTGMVLQEKPAEAQEPMQ